MFSEPNSTNGYFRSELIPKDRVNFPDQNSDLLPPNMRPNPAFFNSTNNAESCARPNPSHPHGNPDLGYVRMPHDAYSLPRSRCDCN